jgi:hypothetical protein
MGDYDNTSLFADDVSYPHITGLLLDQNADLKRGTVLGRITTGGKWTVSASAASDGSQVPRGILAYDVPDPGGDFSVAIYDMGSFVSEKLIYGTGHSASTVEAALRAASIPIRLKSVGAVKAA